MRRSAKLLLQASFLSFFASGLLGPIYAIFVRQIGGDVLEAGTAFGIYYLVSGTLILIFGRWQWLIKNSGRMIFLGYGAITLAQFGYFFVTNPWQLFLTQIIFGMGVAVLEPAWDSVYSVNLSSHEAALYWSRWSGARDIALGLSAFVGSAIVAYFSFTTLFVIMTVVNLITLVLLWPFLSSKPLDQIT